MNSEEYKIVETETMHIFDEKEIDITGIGLAIDKISKLKATKFFVWYAVRMMSFLHYIMDIRATVTSREIEEKILEHEGKSVGQLYDIFEKETEND